MNDYIESIPISNGQDYEEYMLSQKLCPECNSKLIEVMQWDGPDDFECTGLECTDCDYSFGY